MSGACATPDNAMPCIDLTLFLTSSLAYNVRRWPRTCTKHITDPDVRRDAASMLFSTFEDRDPERAERYRAPAGR